VTTIVDMPLNSRPATVRVAAFESKLQASEGQLHVDVGFWGGVVPGNAGDVEPLSRAGVLGFKSFLAPSGVEEFPPVTEADLREALPVLAMARAPLLVHAELPALLQTARRGGDPRKHRTWMETRPVESELAAVSLLSDLAREFGVRIHVVHLSSAAPLDLIRRVRSEGVPLSCETCPHYLTFDEADIPDGATAFKCAPPIRGARERDGLWRGLTTGDIDLVATDHSPAPANLKHLDDGDFLQAWGGIASLEIGLAAVWTAASARGVPIESVARWMAAAPAALARLDTAKGAITAGYDADLVIWDPDAEQVIQPAALHHRHPVTPYAGMQLRGRVHTTILRGQIVFDQGAFPRRPQGRALLAGRGRARHGAPQENRS
jgi:allantoinase